MSKGKNKMNILRFKNLLNEGLKELNIIGSCRRRRLGLWECPNFLFLVMGVITIVANISTYLITRESSEPETVIILVTAVTLFIFIIGTFVVRSVDKLAEINQLKSEFINIVSHQLRAPLTGIKWSLDLLMNSKLDGHFSEKEKSYLTAIKEDNERMIKMVQNLLDVARIQEGRMPIKRESVDLVAIINKVIEEYKNFAKANNVAVNFLKDDNIPLVFADREKMRMTIENLIDNAIKYSQGATQGEVKVVLKRQDKTKVLCCVADQGIGIPPDEQHKIFSKFFRAENSLKHQTLGSGLGLYIAKSIVESLGGKINFSSEYKKGSKFWFTLPVATESKI